jgi:ribosome biogenesis protein SSF1/2
MKLADARRIVLFNLDSDTQEIDLRHYSINVKAVGISKSVKSIIQADIPELKNLNDISDYVLK